jgi:hypothetical protein
MKKSLKHLVLSCLKQKLAVTTVMMHRTSQLVRPLVL